MTPTAVPPFKEVKVDAKANKENGEKLKVAQAQLAAAQQEDDSSATRAPMAALKQRVQYLMPADSLTLFEQIAIAVKAVNERQSILEEQLAEDARLDALDAERFKQAQEAKQMRMHQIALTCQYLHLEINNKDKLLAQAVATQIGSGNAIQVAADGVCSLKTMTQQVANTTQLLNTNLTDMLPRLATTVLQLQTTNPDQAHPEKAAIEVMAKELQATVVAPVTNFIGQATIHAQSLEAKVPHNKGESPTQFANTTGPVITELGEESGAATPMDADKLNTVRDDLTKVEPPAKQAKVAGNIQSKWRYLNHTT